MLTEHINSTRTHKNIGHILQNLRFHGGEDRICAFLGSCVVKCD